MRYESDPFDQFMDDGVELLPVPESTAPEMDKLMAQGLDDEGVGVKEGDELVKARTPSHIPRGGLAEDDFPSPGPGFTREEVLPDPSSLLRARS